MVDFLSSDYWNKRYKEKQTGWDLGFVSPPIQHYADQLTNKELQILIPGCGSGYEGEYLFLKGFRNVYLLDFSANPLVEFKNRVPQFPVKQLHKGDFFEHQGNYDLIIEQTLFCAIDPQLRRKYVEKAASLLRTGGKLTGVLFNRDFEGGPPFGGSIEEYMTYFRDYFSSVYIQPCYNSIGPRKGTEVFIKMIK